MAPTQVLIQPPSVIGEETTKITVCSHAKLPNGFSNI